MSHEHHDHNHDPITTSGEPPAAARVRALEALLVERGVVARDELQGDVLVWNGDILSELDPRKIQVVTRDLVSRLQVSPVAFVTMSEAATSADRRRSRVANGSGES